MNLFYEGLRDLYCTENIDGAKKSRIKMALVVQSGRNWPALQKCLQLTQFYQIDLIMDAVNNYET
jgi:hypothetical protein